MASERDTVQLVPHLIRVLKYGKVNSATKFVKFLKVLKVGHPRPLFHLFLVFSNNLKKFNKLM